VAPPAEPRLNFRRLVALSTLMMLWGTLGSRPAAAEESIPLELQPYRVHLLVAQTCDPVRPCEDLTPALTAQCERTWGGRWQVHVQPLAEPRWFDLAGFAEFPLDEVARDEIVDVRYLVWIARRATGVQVSLRSFEPRWGHRSPVLQEWLLDERELPDRILQLTRRLFRPVAAWEKRDDQSVWLVVKGGGLAEADPEFALFQTGELLTPWLIARRRDGTLARQQAIPWTYFRVESLEQGRGWATAVSGLKSPLAIKARGRMEYVAVAARPQWSHTRFECRAQAQPPRPMSAHRVELRAEGQAAATADSTTAAASPEIVITDRSGGLVLSLAERPKLVWLTIYSGTLKLAYVPVAVGHAPVVRIDLPDDSVRLQAEGQLQLLESELVDEVARRSADIAATRAAAKRQDWNAVQFHLDRLRKQATPQSFLERVSAVRVAAVTAAQKNKDRVTEQRVQRLCDETSDLIRRYLADDRLRRLEEEIAELRAAANEPAPGSSARAGTPGNRPAAPDNRSPAPGNRSPAPDNRPAPSDNRPAPSPPAPNATTKPAAPKGTGF